VDQPPGPAPNRPRYEYNEYPKTLAPNDFWGQVRRTRYGQPISDADVRVIVQTVESGLDLGPQDVLLDLACGNGALSHYLFGSCRAFLGVDSSEYLIQVAKDNFERAGYEFRLSDVAAYTREEVEPERFTKVLCYASLQYIGPRQVASVLTDLGQRFRNVSTVFLGNLPDKDRANLYYPASVDYTAELADPAGQIGVWWSEAELQDLVAGHGWRATIRRMPAEVFNSSYRYDAVLTRHH
jgi:2-polyprenyl-3-methyl-5-hydroxy-6-metoxy-1,4-benzoquinol methylase